MNPLAAPDSSAATLSPRGCAQPGEPSASLVHVALRRIAGIPAAALLACIRLYQRTLSPVLPVLTLGQCGCRFSPTCSHYAAEAIRTHGALRGVALAAIRLVKCTPLHPGGFDPVPPRRFRTPHCARVTA